MLLFLGATGLQMLLAIALLPLTTLRLTAADFGYLALLMSIVAFANALSDCGGTLALPVHFAAESEGERRRMIASFFVVTFTVSVALAVLFALSWVTVAGRVLDADGQPFSWTIDILAAAIIPLRSVSMLSTTIFSVSGRGNAIAAQIAVQAIGTFLGTLICLFRSGNRYGVPIRRNSRWPACISGGFAGSIGTDALGTAEHAMAFGRTSSRAVCGICRCYRWCPRNRGKRRNCREPNYRFSRILQSRSALLWHASQCDERSRSQHMVDVFVGGP
ncbi:oligosaccharide flippase family protein [Bradyrhizobium sp. RDT46]|uniref:oligosaccharide flippase family protein n=1 Tax=Bradyrhizobium sp. RDT46 TaxID=3341829 RepID=UPI0035C7335D